MNFYLQARLGLEDYRVRSRKAVDKYLAVVHLAVAYLEWRLAQERSPEVRTYGDILRRHRDEHAVDWLKGTLERALATQDLEGVLRTFLRLESLPA